MAAFRRVYDSRHLRADCQEPGSVWAIFTFTYYCVLFVSFYSTSCSCDVCVLVMCGVVNGRRSTVRWSAATRRQQIASVRTSLISLFWLAFLLL